MNNKLKRKLLVVIGVLLVVSLSFTYAFFAGGAGPAANTDVNVESGVTTKLTFTEGSQINLELNETTLAEGGGNVSGSTTSSAKLTLGTNVSSATDNYNVYVNIKTNNFVYTTPEKKPEILLSVTDPTGAKAVIEGLPLVSEGIYDITEYKGIITVDKDYVISGSADVTQNWSAEITFINLDTNQALNEGKDLTSEFILQDKTYTNKEIILSHSGGEEFIESRPEPDFTQIADTNEGVFAAPDTYGTAYYYRGAVDNNWVYFNNMYWRIVSVAGDDSLKLMYSGTTAPTEVEAVSVDFGFGPASPFKYAIDDAAYVGYMYTIGERQGHSNSSDIKTALENWYTSNMTIEDSRIIDNIFCYDRSLAKSGYQNANAGYENGEYTGTGIGADGTTYGILERLTASTNTVVSGGTGPILTCPSILDSYTVTDTTNGNGMLTKKVGLLTADEVSMAGLVLDKENTNNYLLRVNSYWLGTPFFTMNGGIPLASTVDVNGKIIGKLTNTAGDVAAYGIPVVYLSSEGNLSGTGAWNDPYILN